MRAARSSSPFFALAPLALALVLAGCNGGATNEANAPVDRSKNAENNAATNFAVNNAPANEAATNAANTDATNATETNSATTNTAPPTTEPAGEKVGIVTTKPGSGPGAKDGDLLAMRYTGRLTSGKTFDSNVNKDPFNLVLGQGGVIKGWEEGLQGVKIGEKRTLKIPAAKGYGAQGAGADIPPNADLVFDIECLDILPEDKTTTIERETLRPGAGAVIKAGQTVTFNFRGTLVDGKEFDSTYKAKKPLTVKLGKGELNPPGLEDAMVGLKLGGKYRLKFPPAVAFGQAGNQNGVPGNAVVFFEIEPSSAK